MRIVSLSLCLLLFVPSLRAFAELTPEEKAQIDRLIQQTGDRDFKAREEATMKLIELGPDVLPAVRKTFESTDDPETRLRCERVLNEVRLIERVLKDFGEKPEGLIEVWPSPDRRTLIYEVRRDGLRALIQDGKESEAFKTFTEHRLSSDPDRFVYIGRLDKGRRERRCDVVVDGKATTYTWAGQLRLSRDGKHLGYRISRDRQGIMVLDGRELPPLRAILDMDFVGEYLVAVGQRGDQWFYVVNGSTCAPHARRVFPLTAQSAPRYVMQDGRELWLCRPELPPKGEALPETLEEVRIRRLALLDEDVAERFPRVDQATPRDLRLWARIGKGHSQVYFDGKLVGDFDGCRGAISPDGERLAVAAWKGQDVRVLCRENDWGSWIDVRHLTFSPDGSRLAFFAQREDQQWVVVCDGKESEPSPAKGDCIVFSRDGRHVAAQFGYPSQTVTLDGKTVGTYDRRKRPRPGLERPPKEIVRVPPAFSPDGEHLAWVGGDKSTDFIVVDGRQGPLMRSVQWLRFSDDGRHLCCMAVPAIPRLTLQAGGGDVETHDVVVYPRYRVLFVDHLPAPWGETIIGPDDGLPLDRLRYVRLCEDNHFRLVEIPWPRAIDWTNGLEPTPKE